MRVHVLTVGQRHPVAAVFWDFHGTLANRPDMWCRSVTAVLNARGIRAQTMLSDLSETLYLTLPWNQPRLGHPHANDREAWWGAVATSFEEIVVRRFGFCGSSQFKDAFPAIRRRICTAHEYRLLPPAIDLVPRLYDRGVLQAIISNHVPELPEIVDGLGLSRYMTAVITSGIEGIEKPRAEIFQLAVDRVQVDPAASLMVGDDARRDLVPAADLGMATAHVDEIFDALGELAGLKGHHAAQ